MTINKMSKNAILTIPNTKGGWEDWNGTDRLYANYRIGSDTYPYEVLAVLSPKRLVVRQMDAEADRANGHEWYGNQVWKITPNERAPEVIITKRKSGQWVRLRGKPYSTFHITRQPYQSLDPHF